MVFAALRNRSRAAALACLVTVVAAVAAAGDAHPRTPAVTRERSSGDEYAPFDSAGTGEISGTGIASPDPGTRVSIASRPVLLRPATSWGRYWWNEYALGNRTPKGYDPRAAAHAREVTADATGRFRFEGLPSGSYLLLSSVLWAHSGPHGWDGPVTYVVLGKRVDLRAGEHAVVTLDSLHTVAALGGDTASGPASDISGPSEPDSLRNWWDWNHPDSPAKR